MWDPNNHNMISESQDSGKNLMEDKCGFYESSRTDSGFLSSTNLTHTSEIFSEEIQPVIEEHRSTDSGLVDDNNKEDKYMRLDSGIVDVGLSETFSSLSLSLTNSSLNNLNSSKIRTNEDLINTDNIDKKKAEEQHPWELYFKQDDDGDT